MRRSALPALALALCSVVSVAFLAGMLVSKLYWGYWLGPPLLDSRVMGADVIAFGGFTTEWWERSFADHLSPTKPPKPRNADPTEYPVEYTLLEMSRFGLSVHAHGELGMDLQEIRRLLLAPGVRLKGSRGYDPNERFSGCWAVLRGSDGEELLFILVDGAEVSNDHHPHQRLLYLRRPNGELRLLSRQLFYFDVAGLERMRWYRISLTLGILGFLVVVPVVLLIHGGGASHPKPHQT